MRLIALFACLLSLSLGACTQSQINTALATPTGALFCAVQTQGGGAMIVTLIDAEASAAAPAGAPVAILATGLAKAKVDADCAAAGGIPVAPPATAAVVPVVAVAAAK